MSTTPEEEWKSLVNRRMFSRLSDRERSAFFQAEQYANDKSVTSKYEKFSTEWYACFLDAYRYALSSPG